MIYQFGINDLNKFSELNIDTINKPKTQIIMDLEQFISNVFLNHKISFEVPTQYKSIKVRNLRDKELNKIINKTSPEEIINYLSKEYGIRLTPRKGKVKIIRIIEE